MEGGVFPAGCPLRSTPPSAGESKLVTHGSFRHGTNSPSRHTAPSCRLLSLDADHYRTGANHIEFNRCGAAHVYDAATAIRATIYNTKMTLDCRIAQRTGLEKRQRHGWPNQAHQRMKSWPSQAIERQRKSPAIRAARQRVLAGMRSLGTALSMCPTWKIRVGHKTTPQTLNSLRN
jgi:hypothetical protein